MKEPKPTPPAVALGRGKATTVMVIDFAGFSSLMHQNEGDALDRLGRFETLVHSETKPFKGRVIKFIGDAVLLTFEDAREAVVFALTFQEKAVAQGLALRAGVHHGYVVAHPGRPDDIIGDAVNVAFRIEGLADAGGIAMTEGVREQVQNAIEWKGKPLHLFRLGPVPVKNIRNAPIVSLVPPADTAFAAWQVGKTVSHNLGRAHRFLSVLVRVGLIATAGGLAAALWISRTTPTAPVSTPAQPEKLPRVQDIEVQPVSLKEAAVTWTAVPGAAGYVVEYGAAKRRQLARLSEEPITDTRATLTALFSGRTYRVRVTAVDAKAAAGYPGEAKFTHQAPAKKSSGGRH